MSGNRGAGQRQRPNVPQSISGKHNSPSQNANPSAGQQPSNASKRQQAIVPSQPNSPRADREKDKPKYERKHPLEYLIFLFVIISALATGAAAFFTYKQWLVATDVEERQLRAYVHFAPGDLYTSNESDGSWIISISPKIGVIGQTPAGSVFIPWDVRIVVADKDGRMQVPTDYVTSGRSRIDVFPGQDRFLTEKSIRITPDDISSLSNGKKIIFFIGTAAYRDVFDKLRWTNFCYTLTWDQIKNRQPQACELHNDADWDANPHSDPKIVSIPME